MRKGQKWWKFKPEPTEYSEDNDISPNKIRRELKDWLEGLREE